MVTPLAVEPVAVCPKCKGHPELLAQQWGNAFGAQCSDCGWYGDTFDVEPGPESALEHWDRKARSEQNGKSEPEAKSF